MSGSMSASRVGAYTTLALSGLIGYYLGARVFPEWQVPVETAQVIAGIVQYPPGNPFLIYHLKLWTVLHQICAALLVTSMSEVRLSVILSGVTGMLSFQALAMTTYTFSRTVWLSIVAVIVVFVTHSGEYGVRYPIFLLGTSHTYGSVGLSWIVLSAALLGCERYRLGLFLLGASPAIHPSLGVWLGILTAISFAMDPRWFRANIRPNWRWCASGLLLTTVSLALQLWTARNVPDIDAATATRYLAAFTRMWDEHRQPMDFSSAGVALNVAALFVGVLWLTVLRRRVSVGGTFLLRFVIVSALVSLACIAVSRLPPEQLPRFLIILMPTRVVNIDAMICASIVFGLAGAYRDTVAGRLLLVTITIGLLLASQALARSTGAASAFSLDPRRFTLAIVAVAAGLLAIFGIWTDRSTADAPRETSIPSWFAVVADAALVGIVLIALLPTLQQARRTTEVRLRDRTNDGLFATASRTTGMLATGGDLHLAQLRTRRPVLLDGGGLDGLPYALAGGPEMARILKDVYEIDFFNPPADARGVGMIPSAYNRRIWEAYSQDRWQQIRRAYNVTQVMTFNNWTLHLPIVAQNAQYLLYEIPE